MKGKAKARKVILQSVINIILTIFLFISILQIGVIANEIDYPTKPITVLIAYAAGGGTDSTARIISSVVYPKYLDQPFALINRPGANGAVAIRELVNSKPDGYTILCTTTSSVVLSPLLLDVGFSLDELTPICKMMDFTGNLCVRPDAPWETLEDLIEYSKANPGKISYSTSGTWSMEDLVMKTLNNMTGTDWISVPFPGAAEAAMACISGACELYAGYGGGNPQIMAGLLRPLVVYGDERINWLPDVPTFKEVGYDIVSGSSFGFFGPPDMPKEIVEKLENVLKNVFDETDAYQKIITGSFGLGVSWKGAEDFDKYNKDLRDQFIHILKELGEID